MLLKTLASNTVACQQAVHVLNWHDVTGSGVTMTRQWWSVRGGATVESKVVGMFTA